MHAPIAEVAIGKVQEVPPAARMYLSVERAQRGWAAIHLPIHSFRWLAVRRRPFPAAPAMHKGAHHANRAGAALLQKFHAANKMWPDAPVQPHLNDSSGVF